jgi:outer membrane cobalamin receptor
LTLGYVGTLFEINWENIYHDEVYIEPYSDKTLNSFVVGNLDFNVKLHKSFYLYARVSNIYDEKYYLRDGYPEPGVQFFGGLRIMI